MTAHRRLLALLVGVCAWADAAAFSALPSAPRAAAASADGASTRVRSTSDGDDDGAEGRDDDVVSDRRRAALLRTASTASSFLFAAAASSGPANAGIDPLALKALPVEGDTTGVASRIRQIESINGPRPEDSKDIAFEVLPSGASYREYREGRGDAAVGNGSKVAAEMTIRAKSFATANEPGGVKYFDTKKDTEFNEVAWTVGSGEFPPELEEAMAGMHKGAVRRIELPSTAVFRARNNQQLPVPSENNKDGKRVYDRLFKTDATLLFEVLVTRIK